MGSQKDITNWCKNIYPSSRTTCLSLFTPYAYSAITFSHSLTLCTYTLQFRGFEGRHYIPFWNRRNTYIFSKSYPLACIAPSLTHILNRTILYSTHTHTFNMFLEAQHYSKRLYMYIYYTVVYRNIPFMTGNNISCFTQTYTYETNT
jgi:hypothetical protein